MANKLLTSFLVIALLIYSPALLYAARPIAHPTHEDMKTETVKVEDNESCQGVNEEECLMRRTLVAHTDYIYTQQQNP